MIYRWQLFLWWLLGHSANFHPPPVRTCCSNHHYTCYVGEDGHPWRCCGKCPSHPDRPDWVLH